jgi:putative ABC transport system permease protein
MALSALLLVGAALLTRSVINLQRIDRGFDSHDLFSMKLSLPRDRYATGPARTAVIERVVDAAGHLPGVIAVTNANATPPSFGGVFFAPIEIEGGSAVAPPSMMPMNFVSPNYFQVLGVKIDGSTFSPASSENSDVIVNRGFEQKYWQGQSAVGRRFRFKDDKSQKADADWMRVVGVADDVPYGSPGADRAAPFIYNPISPKSASSVSVVAVRVRKGVDPSVALQQIVKSIDSHLAPPPVTTVDAALASTVATQRFTMILLTVFAVVAVLLSAIGLYGVISYVVTQRTREIGIRVALGASPANVAAAIVARGLALSVVGLALGLFGSIWGSALIKTALFGVTGTDATSYAIAGVTLLAVSVVACFIPMRRAMRVDPAIAMRGET